MLGAVSFGVCLALELLQHTGVPSSLPTVLRAAFGDTFAWHDAVRYAAGALVTFVGWRAMERS